MTSEATPQRVKWLKDRLEEWLGDKHRGIFEHLTKLQEFHDEIERDWRDMDEPALVDLLESHDTEDDDED